MEKQEKEFLKTLTDDFSLNFSKPVKNIAVKGESNLKICIQTTYENMENGKN